MSNILITAFSLLLEEEEEEQNLCKMSTLKELLRRLEQRVTTLESKNATLKMKTVQPDTTGMMSIIEMDMHLDEQTKKLDREIHTMKGNLNAEHQTVKQEQISLSRKEKQLSDANLHKRKLRRRDQRL